MEMNSSTIRLHRLESPVSVLGPFSRACIWVQGCPFRCPGCITEESLPFDGGFEMSLRELADWILLQSEIEGITISGGEPFSQAEALSKIIDSVREKRDFGVMVYTGYVYEKLLKNADVGQETLLERIDLLIDGPYVMKKHADLLWRGSENQRLNFLTDRYRAEVKRIIRERGDRGAGLSANVRHSGSVVFTGVPQTPGFRTAIEKGLKGE